MPVYQHVRGYYIISFWEMLLIFLIQIHNIKSFLLNFKSALELSIIQSVFLGESFDSAMSVYVSQCYDLIFHLHFISFGEVSYRWHYSHSEIFSLALSSCL